MSKKEEISFVYNSFETIDEFENKLRVYISEQKAKNPLFNTPINIKLQGCEEDKFDEKSVKRIEEVLLVLKKYYINPKKVNFWVSFDNNRTKFSKPEFTLMQGVVDKLQAQGYHLYYDCAQQKGAGIDTNKSPKWNITEVSGANSSINECVDFAKTKKLSPLESLMYFYNIVTSKPYKSESEDENKNISRTIFGVLNTDKIVCVGYAEWIKELVNGMQDPNLVASTLSMQVSKKGQKPKVGSTNHRTNLIYIKDEKYGIDGYYYLDACWDVKNGEKGQKLNFFLVPLGDLQHVKSRDMLCWRNDFVGSLQEIEKTKLHYNNIWLYRQEGYTKQDAQTFVQYDSLINDPVLDIRNSDLQALYQNHQGQYDNQEDNVINNVVKLDEMRNNYLQMFPDNILISNLSTVKLREAIRDKKTIQPKDLKTLTVNEVFEKEIQNQLLFVDEKYKDLYIQKCMEIKEKYFSEVLDYPCDNFMFNQILHPSFDLMFYEEENPPKIFNKEDNIDQYCQQALQKIKGSAINIHDYINKFFDAAIQVCENQYMDLQTKSTSKYNLFSPDFYLPKHPEGQIMSIMNGVSPSYSYSILEQAYINVLHSMGMSKGEIKDTIEFMREKNTEVHGKIFDLTSIESGIVDYTESMER